MFDVGEALLHRTIGKDAYIDRDRAQMAVDHVASGDDHSMNIGAIDRRAERRNVAIITSDHAYIGRRGNADFMGLPGREIIAPVGESEFFCWDIVKLPKQPGFGLGMHQIHGHRTPNAIEQTVKSLQPRQ